MSRKRVRPVIRRWAGYAAYCPNCGQTVPCDGESHAFEKAATVREALAYGWDPRTETLAEYVAECCRRHNGCKGVPHAE